MSDSLGNFGLAVYIILIILIIFVAPIISIAATNTLFDVNIEYSFLNFLCALWLGMMVNGGSA